MVYAGIFLGDHTDQHVCHGRTLTCEISVESVPELDEMGNFIEEVIDPTRHINLEVASDDVQELSQSGVYN
ncbi:hypothetical protein TNCV_2428481 [Trichonephila clavipes]|nr:hypothetical protein TNCV_2428481 [Trichonephila clavipes]